MDPKSGYSMDSGIYYSKRNPIPLPTQHLDVSTFIFSHQQQHQSQPIALVDASSGLSLTYPALRQNARAIAAGLHGLGIRKRDVVLVLSPNSIALPCIHLAILSIGAILTTANPFSTENEIKKQAQDSGSVIIFAPENLIKKARATRLPVILLEGNTNAEGCISSVNLLLQSAISGFPSVDIEQEDTATLLYSSGTTGKSKGVISTHGSLIAGILSREIWELGTRYIYAPSRCFMFLGFSIPFLALQQGIPWWSCPNLIWLKCFRP
jgi:OPC-8:0 CoA ligase-1